MAVAFQWHSVRIEAVDTTGNHCADYSEFFAFCKLQVDALLGAGGPLDHRGRKNPHNLAQTIETEENTDRKTRKNHNETKKIKPLFGRKIR